MRARSYPGDNLIARPIAQSTYSITVEARPAAVWPWLVQMGYHRAGWYIDAWWDGLLQRYFWSWFVPRSARGEFRPPAEEILPGYQDLQVGDVVPDGPPGSAYFLVAGLEAPRHLLLHSTTHVSFLTPPFLRDTRFESRGEFSWAFLLDGLGEESTQLTIRMRAKASPALLLGLLKPFLFLVDYFHVRAMLKGVKRRAEAASTASA